MEEGAHRNNSGGIQMGCAGTGVRRFIDFAQCADATRAYNIRCGAKELEVSRGGIDSIWDLRKLVAETHFLITT